MHTARVAILAARLSRYRERYSGNALYAQLIARPDDTHGNLTAIGNKFLEQRRRHTIRPCLA